jgi:hypothetical protein
MLTSKQKPKLKAKGCKHYQNTNGKTYRVKSKPKPLTMKMLQKIAKHEAEN